MIIQRNLCPYHKEDTPSFIIYDNGYGHCYGCGIHAQVSEKAITLETEPYVEDLKRTFEYIDSLSIQKVRGLDLPTDAISYYIVWPDRTYYNRRFKEGIDFATKYKCPAGHPKKLFVAREHGVPLIVVEGELNALSIALACPYAAVVSPGGANDFFSKNSAINLPFYKNYANILILGDADKAGAQACIELKCKLMENQLGTFKIHLMERDANEILVKNGTQALKEEIEKYLDLSA